MNELTSVKRDYHILIKQKEELESNIQEEIETKNFYKEQHDKNQEMIS